MKVTIDGRVMLMIIMCNQMPPPKTAATPHWIFKQLPSIAIRIQLHNCNIIFRNRASTPRILDHYLGRCFIIAWQCLFILLGVYDICLTKFLRICPSPFKLISQEVKIWYYCQTQRLRVIAPRLYTSRPPPRDHCQSKEHWKLIYWQYWWGVVRQPYCIDSRQLEEL